MNAQDNRCGQCFAATDEVVEQTFDQPTAFNRFAELVRARAMPMMCETESGAYRVCHVQRSEGA